MNKGYVYLAINDAYKIDGKHIIKIGYTDKHILIRMKDLSKDTGVLEPFECIHLFHCENARKEETDLHMIFRNSRCKMNKEFFAVDPECIIRVMKLKGFDLCDLEHHKNLPLNNQVKKKRVTKISDNKKERIITLFRKGMSNGDIVTELKTTPHHVSKTIKEYKEKKGFTNP